jgi:hypothetical protein
MKKDVMRTELVKTLAYEKRRGDEHECLTCAWLAMATSSRGEHERERYGEKQQAEISIINIITPTSHT